MKNLQTTLLKILLLSLLSFSALGQANDETLAKADSLFRQKQFTQSFQLYQQLLSAKVYSPAMLLKMAFIQEGSNEIGLCLYYLTLYLQQTDDHQAITKINELATRYHLEGYTSDESISIAFFVSKYAQQLKMVTTSVCVLLLAILYYQKRKNQRPIFAALLFILFAGSSLFFANSSIEKSGIIKTDQTYLMTGPSAASSVWRIVKDGHKVVVTGEKDVWLRIKWNEKEVYIKKSSVLPLSI